MANAVQGGLNTSNPADHILPEINGWTYLHWAAAVDANEAAQVFFSTRTGGHAFHLVGSCEDNCTIVC